MFSGGFDVVDFVLFCIAAVLSPPVISTDNLKTSRRFGGYRIVPKACNTTDDTQGVCMFNNDCAKINGTVAGSCTDGFLFGSCCKLTEGSYYISVPLSLNPLTSSQGLVIPETISTTNKINVPSNIEDTVLLHHDGTVIKTPYKPIDFVFNSRPELYLSNGSNNADPLGDKFLSKFTSTSQPPTTDSWYTKDPVKNKYTTPQNLYKSSTKFILSTQGLNYDYGPSTESSHYATNDFSNYYTNYQGIKDVTNQDSIYHILNILNDTDPVAEESSTTQQVHYQSPSVTRYPSTVTRYPSPVAITTGNYYSTKKQPQVTVKPTSKPCKPQYSSHPNKHNLLVLNNKGCPPDDQDVTIGANTNNNANKHQVIINSTPQITIDPYKPTKPVKNKYPTINYNKYTTSKPSTNNYFNYLTQSVKPTKSPQLQYTGQNKKNSTHYVHLTGIQVTSEVNVTPKPGSGVVYEPIPTVILLETPNTTPKPTKTAITIHTSPDSIISVNGNYATFRPPSNQFAGSQTPIYPPVSSSFTSASNVRPVTDKLGPLYTVVNSNPKPEQYNPPISGMPLFEPVGSVITTPTQVLKITPQNSSEILVAFPPDRDPSANISYLRPDPEIVSWVSTKPDDSINLLEDDSSSSIIEDQTFDTKVHSFVEKIVQNLQGNFVDLENVLIDGQANITSTPTKKPSKPSKKPTKKPSTNSTKPLITKPPPRPVSTSQRPVKITETVATVKPTKQPVTTEVPIIQAADVELSAEDYTPERINRECGIRPLMKNGRIVGGKGATFGEWPWQVLVREATWLGLFTKNKCGGVLITNRYVITAAHCQPGFLASLIAVFGEYDISGEIESRRSVSRNVRRVIVHRYYNAATFENDISLLELETPVQFDKHIIPICMPTDNDDFTGKVATVTGWGRLKYGGGVPSVLQEVHVPVIDNNVCQEMFHTAGHSKTILSSFICAGYANGQRDSCEGDSGGPLMVERDDGHWVLAGTVSHGIKCAAPYLPGVYMRTTYYKPWIQTITGVKDKS